MESESPRWKETPSVVHPLQIAWTGVFILCLSSLFLSWLNLDMQVEFTAGKPERSELIFENEVNAEMETAEFRIEKATPFVTWMFSRDSLQEERPEEEKVDNGPQSRVDNARTMIVVTVFAMCTIAFISAIRGPMRMRWVIAFWVLGLLLLTIAIPYAWIMDMSARYDDGLPEDEVPVQEFAHVNSKFGTEIVYIGASFSFDGDGWDLGLIDESNRTNVTENEPHDPDFEHEAHIQWDAAATIRYGNALTSWLICGLLLIGIFIKQRKVTEIPSAPPKFSEEE